MGDEDGVAREVAAIRDNAASRSPLYRYLWRHRRALARAMGSRRIDWAAVAAELAARDLHDAAGRPASAEAVQRTWARVRGDDMAARGRSARKPTRPRAAMSTAVGAVAPGVRLATIAPVAQSDGLPPVDEEEQVLVLEAAAPRQPSILTTGPVPPEAASHPDISASAAPCAGDGSAIAAESAEDALSHLRAALEAKQPRMPRVARSRMPDA